jgi:hypothetical protein
MNRKKGAQIGLIAMVAFVIGEYFQPPTSRTGSHHPRNVGNNASGGSVFSLTKRAKYRGIVSVGNLLVLPNCAEEAGSLPGHASSLFSPFSTAFQRPLVGIPA